MTHFFSPNLGQLIVPAKLQRAGKKKYPILSMTMRHGLVDQETKFKKRIASTDTSNYKVIRRNQLVVGFPIDEGVLAIQKKYEEAIVSPAYDVWNVDLSIVDPIYLERFLKSQRAIDYYTSKLRGSTARRRTLPDDIFLKMTVPLPSLSQQRRIALILDKAEELVAKRRQAIALLDQLPQVIFFEMFGDPAENPKNWPVESIRSVAILENGDRSAKYPSGNDIVASGVPFVSTKNIINHQYSEKRLIFITPEKFANLSQGKLRTGDIIITLRGTLGQCAIFRSHFETGFINAQLMIIRTGQSLSSDFLHALISSRSLQKQLSDLGHGGAIPQLTGKQIGNLAILMPPIDLQLRFADRLKTIGQVKTAHQSALLKAEALFASLQSQAFTSELSQRKELSLV